MCGICGFNNDDKNLLKKMCDIITHRGPDDKGYFTDSNVSIGMRRLEIIDLKGGYQPQHNENEDIWIVYNGEIYNFLDLRHKLENFGHQFYTNSDTEVIIHAYEEWGFNCINKFRGAFAICIYDSIKEILILVRDPLGLKPLYYYYNNGKFIFGSEIKCLLIHSIERKINKRALNYFHCMNYIPNQGTLFTNIYKVPPSSYLVLDLKKNKIEIKKYWNNHFKINYIKSDNILAKELRNLLEESIKIRLLSEVPLGAFLSGGLDSSIVVGLMSKFMDEPVKTFSIGFEKGSSVNETKYARIVSEYFETDHTELIIKSNCYDLLPQLVWHLDDLIGDPAILPIFSIAKLARDKITVALTGDGADEIFAGYAENYWLYSKKYLKYIPKNIIDKIMNFYDYIPSHKLQIILSAFNSSITEEDRFFKPLLIVKEIEKSNIFPFKTENIQDTLKKKLIKKVDVINQYINYDLKYQLPNFYNMKTDKMSMAASLEARIPMLDLKIVEWSGTIPSHMKLRNNTEKYILKLATKDLLPPQIVKRKKLGFGTPISLWFETGMKEISGELLERLETRKSLIKSDYIKKVNKNKNSKLYHYRVWNLIMFELWYETFLENDGLKPISY